MTELAVWIAVIIVASGVFALGRQLVARLRGRDVEARLICPKTGAHVRCTLVYDDRRDLCLGVSACSAFPPGVTPTCEQSCARLLNLGLPIENHDPGDR